MDCDHYDQIIVGGGVAGLACANHLADLGASPLLIEGGDYPTHKVCGEFFSPECLPFLHEWGLEPPQELTQAKFVIKGRTSSYSFDPKPKTLSRYCFDESLAERARQKGAKILTNTRVSNIQKERESYRIYLESGKYYTCTSLIISTGRILSALYSIPKKQTKYIGFKAHFKGIKDLGPTLEIHSFPGCYVGISPIEEEKVNVTGIALKSAVDRCGGLASFMAQQQQLTERLSGAKMLFNDWLTVAVPPFHWKSPPDLPSIYLIGDAAASIHPICGDGLAMAITSARLVAPYILKGDWKGFRASWKKAYSKRLRMGKFLHHIMLRPNLCHLLSIICQRFPSLFNYFYHQTRS